MGNCSSRAKKRRKGIVARAERNGADQKSAEDVTYASIDHGTAECSKKAKTARAPSDTDCDYATVNVPAALRPEPGSEESSNDDCAEDYVVMG